MTQGPNVRKLICHKIAVIAIPAGTKHGLADGVNFLRDRDRIANAAREATGWVNEAIELVKRSPGNEFGDDDEAIAGEILRQIEKRKQQQRERRSQ